MSPLAHRVIFEIPVPAIECLIERRKDAAIQKEIEETLGILEENVFVFKVSYAFSHNVGRIADALRPEGTIWLDLPCSQNVSFYARDMLRITHKK